MLALNLTGDMDISPVIHAEMTERGVIRASPHTPGCHQALKTTHSQHAVTELLPRHYVEKLGAADTRRLAITNVYARPRIFHHLHAPLPSSRDRWASHHARVRQTTTHLSLRCGGVANANANQGMHLVMFGLAAAVGVHTNIPC